MEKETSYGIIPIRFEKHEQQLFLVRHQAGHWSFPKGHPNKNETIHDTATRELKEETGLHIVRFLPSPSIEEKYTCKKDGKLHDKTVTYFLAEVEGEILLQTEEIAEGKWVSFEEALKLITFKAGRRVCNKAQAILNPFKV